MRVMIAGFRRFLPIVVLTAGLASQADVVVEQVEPGTAAYVVQLQPGDVLSAWEIPAGAHTARASGVFRSPLDIRATELEQAARGVVTIAGTRSGSALTIEMPRLPWGLVVRPELSDATHQSYRDALTKADQGALDSALEMLRTLADQAVSDAQPAVGVWLLQQAAQLLGRQSLWEEAEAWYSEAVSMALVSGATEWAGFLRRAEGELHAENRRFESAIRAYKSALEHWQSDAMGQSLTSADTLRELGTSVAFKGDLPGSEPYLKQALEMAQRLAPESTTTADALHTLGMRALQARDRDGAGEYLSQSLALAERVSPDSLLVAMNLRRLATLAGRRELDLAEGYQRRAIEITEKIAPQTFDHGTALYELAHTFWFRRDLDATYSTIVESLKIFEKERPDSMFLARAIDFLGVVAWARGDLATAEDHYTRAMEIQLRQGSGGVDLANIFNNLASVAWQRGNLALAIDYHTRALELRDKAGEKDQRYASNLSNLGLVYLDRGQLTLAEDYFRRALALGEQLETGALEIASKLHNLGVAAIRREDLDAAEAYHRRSLALRENVGGGELPLASSLDSLGRVAALRGDLTTAEAYYQRSLQIRRKEAPKSLQVANTLDLLGGLHADKGEFDAALSRFQESRAIRARLAPGTAQESLTLAEIGRLHWRRGHKETALAEFELSIDALESQQGKLGGSESSHSVFRSTHMSVYRDAIDLLVELGQDSEAFQLFERSRARGMLALLAERDVVFASEAPELERERRSIARQYDTAQKKLSDLTPEEGEEKLEGLLAELRELRQKQAEVREALRQRSPRLASLRYPQPLNLDGARQALDEGTALLAYSIGEARSQLFVVDPVGALTIHTLPEGVEDLGLDVKKFRELIESSRKDPSLESEVRRYSALLYDKLVAPAVPGIQRAKRVLIVPDGPLRVLPFSALLRPRADDPRRVEYLVEWKPLHYSLSVTVYNELQKVRRVRDTAGTTLMAFGAPSYPERTREDVAPQADAVLRAFDLSGRKLDPIPATRDEVVAITKLYGNSAKSFLGSAATETQAKAIDTVPRLIHFAAHGLIDDRFPLDSAIALSIPDRAIPGKDNGLLQAWEVFEELRLDADLVVLSACDSALGTEVDGEGLVGLTRAFQYAGARSVLASRWSVADRSTSELMKRFYAHLKRGQAKDEALRSAQLDLIQGRVSAPKGLRQRKRGAGRLARAGAKPQYDAPFYWAAFELIGDWK